MERKEIGRVSHYFGKPQVAAIVLTDDLKVGDTISIQGHTTDFEVVVESIQIEHDSLAEAGAGDNVGIKVPKKVREHDVVYKIIE
ncbi:MAG: translation elongation factor-like protein [Candidatus Eisenbacteria sp.]|nr:translation elongation factor-like protein [Candidatus Eisenbacteria bacterium]